MSADWRNEQAILRDLAIAQGIVPVESVETVSCYEKPPSVQIREETEEEFIRQYAADGTSVVAPDFGLIQDMLELVRDVRVNDIENEDENTAEGEKGTESPQKSTNNTRRNKNAAIESILNQQETEKGKEPIIVLQPKSMFKPKSKTSVNAINEILTNDASKSPSNVKKEDSRSKPGVFVPSNNAQEYYNKLMEAKRKKEMREETIWTRAERLMREKEEKRRNEVAN